MKKPDLETFLKILYEEYLKMTNGKLCEPVTTKDGLLLELKKEDLFTRINKRLKKLGYDELSWEDFREYMSILSDEPKYWGKICISWYVARTNRLEPVVIAICKPLES